MKGFTVDIKIQDSSRETIHVEPVVSSDQDFRRVYKLYKCPPNEYNYLGNIAIHKENAGDWKYSGDILNIEEQKQIAVKILNNISDQENESFYVQAFYKGGMNSFEVIPIENYFVIAFGGQFIAKIEHNEEWEQTSGDPLDEDVFVTIKQAIEEYSDNRR
jgi:hypothetical protein